MGLLAGSFWYFARLWGLFGSSYGSSQGPRASLVGPRALPGRHWEVLGVSLGGSEASLGTIVSDADSFVMYTTGIMYVFRGLIRGRRGTRQVARSALGLDPAE